MNLRQFLGVVEMRTKVVSVSTLAAATLYALRETGSLDPGLLALTLPAVLLVDMGTTAFNNFFDYWRGVDRGPRVREADKVLAAEGVPALAALLVAAACYFGAAVLGAVLAARAGAWVVGAGLGCMAAGFLYNGGPRPLSRGPFGEAAAGLFLGCALFLIAFRLQAPAAAAPLGRAALASIPGTLFIASILAVNNACDSVEDRASGRRTLAILVGPRAAAAIPFVLGGAAYAATGALVAGGVLPLAAAPACAAALLASLPAYAALLRRGFSHETKSGSMRRVLAGFGLWSLGLAAGLAFSIAAGRG